ncbi:MAG: HlyC/CorC family transporter [Chloroflexi bacterium]|nr:HlyC/CorC family transporter [Chloroflexota bacterium]
MAMTAYVALSLILIFATGSFFFALAESALFSLGKWRAQQLAERVPGDGQRVAALLQAPQDVLATIVLGNTVANGGLLATAFWVALRDGWPALPCFAGLVILILIGGEVVPKTLAVRTPELWSLRVARPMLWMQKLSRPLREVAQGWNTLIIRSLTSKSVRPPAALTDEEYQELLEMAYQQGALARSEKEIILQIISLDRRTAKDVMRPRSQMACISDDLSIEDMIAAARRHKHRRLPIYDETPDTIVGILNTRALLLDPQIDLADAIEFPSFVPESMNLLRLLKSLQKQQRGLAIVLDEFGGTAGLVTMEDILEVTIGEIRSETEESGFVMEKLGPGRWRVSGTMRCDDFRREYAELGEVTDADTMGGLMVSQLEVVPAQGQSVAFRGLRLTAQTADERRVRELLVEVLKKGETG